jgi:hypothetical protein
MRKAAYYALVLLLALRGLVGVWAGLAQAFGNPGSSRSPWHWCLFAVNLLLLAGVGMAFLRVTLWRIRFISALGALAIVKFTADVTGVSTAMEKGAWAGTIPLILCGLVAAVYSILTRVFLWQACDRDASTPVENSAKSELNDQKG